MVPRTSQCSGTPVMAGAMTADSILTSVPKVVAIRSEHLIMGRPNDDLEPSAKAITIPISFMPRSLTGPEHPGIQTFCSLSTRRCGIARFRALEYQLRQSSNAASFTQGPGKSPCQNGGESGGHFLAYPLSVGMLRSTVPEEG